MHLSKDKFAPERYVMTWIGSLGFFAFAESIWLWRGVLEVVDQVLIGDPPNRLHVLFDKSQILFLLLKLPNVRWSLIIQVRGLE